MYGAWYAEGLVFGVVGAVLMTICSVRWRIGLLATFAGLVVFQLWNNWVIMHDPNVIDHAGLGPPTAGDVATATTVISILGLLPLVVGYLLVAAVGKRMVRLHRKP